MASQEPTEDLTIATVECSYDVETLIKPHLPNIFDQNLCGINTKKDQQNLNLKHTITLFHQNIASVLSKRDILEAALAELGTDIGEISIICLSETFLRRGTEANLRLVNYTLAASYCRQHQRRGGTCILLKNGIEYKATLNLKPQDYSFECCGVELLDYNLHVICIYRTPDSPIETFFKELSRLLNSLRRKNIVLCGDWNIDVMTESRFSKELLSILSNHSMINRIDVPTRRKSCIDLIVTNATIEVEAKVHCLALSDHETGQSISFQKEYSNNVPKLPTFWFEYRRDVSDDNLRKFTEVMSCLSFDEVISETSVERAFNLFHDVIVLFFEMCFPIEKKKTINKPIKNRWLSKGIKRCCITKRSLYMKYIMSHSSTKKDYKITYKNYATILKKCIHNCQKIQNTNYIKNSKNTCKASWDIIKNNIAKIEDKKGITSIKIKDTLHTNASDISELFNNFFIDLTNTSDSKDKNNQVLTPLISHRAESIYLSPVDEKDIFNIIMTLKNTASTGYDKINTKILKLCARYIAKPLTHIINLSFTEGKFPSRLKQSVVKPLYKKGERNDMNNYRPVTLIPVLSKIIEKAMYNKIYSFVTQFKILKEQQFGFRKNRSTTLACFSLINNIIQSLDSKMAVASIFLDMSKAFDFVSHPTLLEKLYRYGIRGNCWEWINSYLSHRTQCVEIEMINNKHKKSFHSKYRSNDFGVPQGSVLGPLLFLLYINDLPDMTKNECVLFADDTTLIVKCKNRNELQTEIGETLESVSKWLECNNLKVNIEKTQLIQFQTHDNANHNQLIINHNNTILAESDSTIFLGVTIDKFCNWKAHVDKVCLKLNRFVYALRRMRDVATREATLSAYHGYVAPVLRYGLILWGNSVDVKRAFITQKKCIRALCGAGFIDSCKPLFKKLGILPLPCMYIFEVCIFVKKYPDLFRKNCEVFNCRGRSKNKLYLPPQRLKLFSNSPLCMSIKIFNTIPEELKDLKINLFKIKLFNFLLENMFYNVSDFLKK